MTTDRADLADQRLQKLLRRWKIANAVLLLIGYMGLLLAVFARSISFAAFFALGLIFIMYSIRSGKEILGSEAGLNG